MVKCIYGTSCLELGENIDALLLTVYSQVYSQQLATG